MNELDKCMAGEIYDCHDAIFLDYKNTARRLLGEYNRLPYDAKARKREILESLFGQIGENVSVGLPFICDYGRNSSTATSSVGRPPSTPVDSRSTVPRKFTENIRKNVLLTVVCRVCRKATSPDGSLGPWPYPTTTCRSRSGC